MMPPKKLRPSKCRFLEVDDIGGIAFVDVGSAVVDTTESEELTVVVGLVVGFSGASVIVVFVVEDTVVG